MGSRRRHLITIAWSWHWTVRSPKISSFPGRCWFSSLRNFKSSAISAPSDSRLSKVANNSLHKTWIVLLIMYYACVGSSSISRLVSHFEITSYPLDGRGKFELGFEEILAFDQRGGFNIRVDSRETRNKRLLRHQGVSYRA